MKRLIALCCLMAVPALGASDYSKRFGVRFATGTSGYTALASKSYGLVFPLGLEGTYGITNSLEVFAGFRGIISLPLKTDAPYPQPYSASLGMRYYYNVNEPIKAYTAIGLNVGLDRFAVELFPSTWGIQWDIDDNISIFGDGGFGLLFGRHPTRAERWEASIRVGIQLGVHYHF